METAIQSNFIKIELNQTYKIDNFLIQTKSHLGYFTDINYYQVIIKDAQTPEDVDSQERLGLLRVGAIDGGLQREMELRKSLGEHKMTSQLLACQTSTDFFDSNPVQDLTPLPSELEQSSDIEEDDEDLIKVESKLNLDKKTVLSSPDTVLQNDDEVELENVEEIASDNDSEMDGDAEIVDDSEMDGDSEMDDDLETNNEEKPLETPEKLEKQEQIKAISEEEENDYLQEETYPPKPLISEGEKLIVLSEFPTSEETLTTWLEKNESPRDSLLLVSQVTQFFRLVSQEGWCFVSLLPQFIKQSQEGNPVQFFDLTTIYPLGETLDVGLTGEYYPPEISSKEEIREQMSTYVAGTLLYQAVHHKLPPNHELVNLDENLEENLDLEIKKIPRIYQILNISLSFNYENRFPLSQLLNLLISTRKYFEAETVRWEVCSRSTVGLSTSRLENEDNYGVLQPSASNEESLVLAVVADGMGGMAKGEVASKTAVETVLSAAIPSDLESPQKCNEWLTSLVSKANKEVCGKVRKGGTTLSMVMAIARKLYLAHVGDSRIFLLRKGTICQLSEDHSVVAMLLATGQITYEESQNHPDKNMLTKSLGSNPLLPHNYVQNLSRFYPECFLTVEDEDILLLCSDGVWDLVNAQELAKNFSDEEGEKENKKIYNTKNLHLAVTKTIEQVIERGGHDNATLVALKCNLERNSF